MNKNIIIEKAKNVKKVRDLNSLIMDLHSSLTTGEFLKTYIFENSIIYMANNRDSLGAGSYLEAENTIKYLEPISKGVFRKKSVNSLKHIIRENKCKFKILNTNANDTELTLNGTEVLVKTINTDDLIVYTVVKPHIVVNKNIARVISGINEMEIDSNIKIDESDFNDSKLFIETIESYIFSKKHGFRIFKNSLLTSSQKNSTNMLNLNLDISLAIEDEDYEFLENVATHASSLSSKLKREYIENFKNKEKSNELRYFFYNIDDKVDFSKPLNENDTLSSSNALAFDDTKYLENVLKDYSIISTIIKNPQYSKVIGLKYTCNKCMEVTDYLIDDNSQEYDLDELYYYNKEVLLNNINKVGCKKCKTKASFNIDELDNLKHFNFLTNAFLILGPKGNLLFNHLFYKKNTVLLYRYSDRFKDSISMNFSTFHVDFNTSDNKCCLKYNVQPKSLSSISFSSKKPKMEYYIDENSAIKRYTPSSLKSSINCGGYYSSMEQYPIDKEQLIKDFEKNGFNEYGVYDIYAEQNDLSKSDYYKNMILWEGTFPALIKLMPVVDSMFKIDKYKNIGLDLINDKISSNEINSIFDTKETNPKKVLKLNNFKVNIYNEFLEKNALSGYNYNMIKTMEVLSSYTEDFDYDIYSFFYKAFNGQSYIISDINNNISIFKTLLNKVLKLNLPFDINISKFIRNIVKIIKTEYFMNLNEFRHIIQTYIDYIDILLEYKPINLIQENDILLEELEREHDRLVLVAENLFINSNNNYKQKFNETMNNIKNFLNVELENENYVVVVPDNYEDMIREGNKLNHCVGSYITAVAQKRKTVVFIRSKDDKDTPLYTLELSGVYKEFQNIENKQFRGKFNSVPSSDAKIFVIKYIQELNKKKKNRLLAN